MKFAVKPKRIVEVISVLCLTAMSLTGAESVPSPKPLFRKFMGLNGHTVQFRPELYHPVARLVRDYHPVEWDLGTDSDSIPPFPEARNGVDWKGVYGSWHRDGWAIDASLMFETLPRVQWKELARDSGAYAEYFGRAFGPSGKYPSVESVEIGNEPGKFSDADYRVIFENMARGFRAADARLRVATGAVTTGKSHEYAKSVDCLAGLEALYDILNVHTYAQLKGWPTWQRSFPEDPRLTNYLGDVRRLCDWRDQHAPGKEVWITEFGYDATSRTPDPKSEFKDWIGVTETQQAQWTVRSWLTFATLPVQRAYLYYFNDDDSPHVHGSSGLTRNFQPKPAFYAAAHLQGTLGDFRFARTVLDRPAEALIYEFAHATDLKRRIWVARSPTAEDHMSQLLLPEFDGVVERIESMPLNSEPMESPKFEIDGRKVPISGSPTYIFIKLR